MDKQELKKSLIQFRDNFKEYQNVVREIWKKRNLFADSNEIQDLRDNKEKPLREKLINNFGRLERYLIKMDISTIGTVYNRSFSIFDSALDETLFDNSIKGESLKMAVQMAIKAVGVIESLDEREIKRLEKQTTTVFISYNFAGKNKNLVEKFIDFVNKFDVSVSLGSEINTISISDKVKTKIDDADIIIAIMTKDEQNEKGDWSPSKWIIEELAYALAGKEKEIIRLLENGCTTEGRIFGDREYIPFDRDDLAETFTKLAEVLNKKIK